MKKLYLQTGATLSTLDESKFEQELVLQELLEQYPELIPSEEIIGNPSFFLIQREFSVSTGYIDHLFIDQMMVPTIVETKVNNPEIRRKIIGQGYEYLTSLSFELTGKQIVESAKQYWKDRYLSEVQRKLDLKELNVKEIDRNLKKPRLRLIFAADFIPRELRKFVEFINSASRGIDVYAVQLEQFLLDDKKIFSVSCWGPTESVVHDKSVSFGLLSREEFINKINSSQDLTPSEKEIFIQRVNEILDIAEERHLSIGWGTKSFRISYSDNDSAKKMLEFYCNGNSWVIFVPFEERSLALKEIYSQLDSVFDLQKKHLDPKSQFKMGTRNLYALSNERFELLISVLKTI
ncbi:MAG: hypothetical protein PHW72_03700 [Candidatus Pacebacteria bacterium]|nr:hypothetical protein [Candidatus Paceibacterota bacterium]